MHFIRPGLVCRAYLKCLFQLERLYVEVLFTIENKLGSSCPQYTEMNTDLISYAQEAFGVSQKIHEHLLGVACGEKVLGVKCVEIYIKRMRSSLFLKISNIYKLNIMKY